MLKVKSRKNNSAWLVCQLCWRKGGEVGEDWNWNLWKCETIMIHLYVSGKFLKAFTSKKKDLERNFIALQFQPFYFQGTLTKIQILLFWQWKLWGHFEKVIFPHFVSKDDWSINGWLWLSGCCFCKLLQLRRKWKQLEGRGLVPKFYVIPIFGFKRGILI